MARILLLEDDDPLADSMARSFAMRGHQVTRERNIFGGIDRLRDGETFDVILSDYAMPGGTGIDFYRMAEELFDPDGDYPTRILWSGNDVTELAAELEIEHVLLKGLNATTTVFAIIEART